MVERSVVAIVAVAAVALESAFRYFETVGSSVSSVADQVVEFDSGIPEVVCDLVVEALGAGATVHWDNSECHVPRLGHNIGGSSVMKSRFYIKRLGNSVARLGVRRGWRSRGVHFLSVCLAELFCRWPSSKLSCVPLVDTIYAINLARYTPSVAVCCVTRPV